MKNQTGMSPAALQAALDGDIDNAIVASTPGGIEAQEAAGQKDFVASQTLPKDCPREELEKLGFVFGDDADDIFINVQFPDGWTKKATGHSMHNDLLDEKGRKRGGIFYKAAFYDRHASLHLTNRYRASQDYDLKGVIQFNVLDGDKSIFKTDPITVEEYSEAYWKAQETAEKEATEWLVSKYPQWKDVSAYWD